ncbi:DUF4352 domain-containing protein [Clostridium tetani]|uniref:DUF4352 domain-containing protein n=1 Tax=Clostridium tetani TaxID=1513 RepID=UPI000627C9F1|nr:DUF4352 domain-containing protein [Clostridium tetani]RXI72145.1 DUF4352 domain-containing protein [Clostridium tetani]BDR75285.1 hypothetical protein K154306013_09450 [Clostridium tetani]
MEQNIKTKKPFYKKWWFWLLAVIVIGGVGSNIGKDNPKKVGETSAKVEDKKTESNKPKIFKVGDVVELKDFKVTVNKVYTVNGGEFTKPAEGNEFIAVDCTVENISQKEQGVSSMLMFKVVDKDGRACEYSITGQTAANAGQMDGQLAPGRKLTGVYVVEVKKGTKGLELEFNSSLFSGGQVIVKLN